jgi:hypothetical protein
MFIGLHVQYNLNFLDRCSNNSQLSNFMQIVPVGAKLFCAGEQTDEHDGANSRVSQFSEPAQ